jgi:hypothetical protein
VPADDVAFAGAAAQARLLRDRAISAPELLDLHLGRIARLDPVLNAFRTVCADAARAEAQAAQRLLDAGEQAPLLGVPIAIKDNVDMAGELTCHGTGAVTTPAAADSEVVRRLRASGAVLIGRTHLPELAMWARGRAGYLAGIRQGGRAPRRARPARAPHVADDRDGAPGVRRPAAAGPAPRRGCCAARQRDLRRTRRGAHAAGRPAARAPRALERKGRAADFQRQRALHRLHVAVEPRRQSGASGAGGPRRSRAAARGSARGPPNGEGRLLSVGAQLEAAHLSGDQRPPTRW